MALDANINRIKFLRTKTAGSVPAASLLDEGELAINLADRTIYSKNGANIVELGFGKGGNVSGAITAPQFNGPLVGNASTTTKLQTARTISLTGSATGSISFDGTSDQNISVNVNKLDVLAAYSKSNSDSPTKWEQGIQSVFVSSTQGWPMSYGGVITARPYANGGGTLQIMTAYGSDSGVGGGEIKIRTGDYNGLNNDAWTSWKTLVHSENVNNYSPTKTGVGASGTWGINVTGNAESSSKLQTPRTISLVGDGYGSVNFDGSANASINLTLNDVNNSAGTYGANHLEIPTFTLNKKGLLTSAGNRAFPYAGVGQYGAAILYDGLDSHSTSHSATANIVRHLNAVKVDINKSFNDAFGSDVDHYIAPGNLKGFTSCADFPVGSRMIVDVPAFSDMPSLGSSAIYFETKRTYTSPGKLQIAYGYNNGRTATRSAGTGGGYSDWVYTVDTSSISRYRQDSDATRIYSPNLQKSISLTDSGVYTPDLIVLGKLLANNFASDSPYAFLRSDGQAQSILAGSLLISNDYSETAKIPYLGIYAKGVIESVAGFKGKLLAKDLRNCKPYQAETEGISAYFVTEVGLNNDYVGGNYGDFLSLNTYHDASAGMQNGLFFDKTGKRIVHYQSGWGAANWGSGKTLAYAEDVLSINGGTINGRLNVSDTITVTGVGDHANAFKKLIQADTTTDGGYIAVGNHGSDKGYIELGTIDDADAAIYARKRNGANAVLDEAVLLGPDGNTSFPKSVFIHNVPSGYGTCGLVAGNADNSAYTGCNIDITSWFGLGIKSSHSGERTVVFNTRTGDISNKGSLNSEWFVNANRGLGINNTEGVGHGLSLYGGAMNGLPEYGIAFAKTDNFGRHGYVDGDWATYFTMTGAHNRGWIFRHAGLGNVASISSQGNAYFNGSIIAAGNITAYSDKKLKENILPISDALNKVNSLNGVTYTRNDLEDKTLRHVGLIAQDVLATIPEAVRNDNDTLSVDYMGLIGVLVESIKELKLEIDELKEKVK